MKRKKKETITIDIPIPSSDGESIAHTIPVEVAARYDQDLEDYVLDGDAMAKIDRVKARHMGLMQPEEIKALRTRLGLTQKEISELLQIGEKSWSRWETGRERPSRSMNILIMSLNDGKVDVNYLRRMNRTSKTAWENIDSLRDDPKKFISLNISEEDYDSSETELREQVA